MSLLTEATDTALATLILLSRRARESDVDSELRFLLVNETCSLISYQQAALWSVENGVETLSGVSFIDKHSAYVIWLNHWFSQTPEGADSKSFITDLSLLSVGENDWNEWLPSQVANIKLSAGKNFTGGQLLLARQKPFSQTELSLLDEWADIWSHRYQYLHAPTRLLNFKFWKPLRTSGTAQIAFILLVALIGFIPVRLSVLAPAELTPLEASIIRSPIDGIVDRMLVEPNQRVSVGDSLFEFDRVNLDNELAQAQQALLTSQAEYRQKAQRAVYDSESKAQLAVLQSLVNEKVIEVNYLTELYGRSSVKSPREGLVLLNDETEWIGRPVVTGERVLVIADEQQVQVEAWLSPGDFIQFPDDTELTLYLNADPSVTIKANVTYISHLPEMRPEGVYAHRIRAHIKRAEGQFYQIGLKGTARVEGGKVKLVYWLFRRPLAALRGWIGF